ncbi:MAG TPA: A/G-specific adenine glycosylase [Candidatus Limnocylindrales bacterium]|nr:A/G-specific adenine glycosylase [Candidatus Limnocylindrales bacterium]
MLTGQPLSSFRKNLLAWFTQFQRDLPWRRTRDPYRIWLSEIMLQQTRVAAAIPYYERFLERFPDVETLARAPQEEVLRLWSGLGYYSRARNLQKAAQAILTKHNGIFPSEPAEALALPGIGAYTAAAILSIAYQKKLAVLDGNVARVVARLAATRGDLRANGTWQKLQLAADRLLDEKSPGDWNQAMMELGATLCTPRSPQCLLCPLTEFCEARKLGLTDAIPEKRSKRSTVEITLASLVLLDGRGNTLLLAPPKSRQKSSAPDDVHTLVSRMWHFPTISLQKTGSTESLRKFAEKSLFRGRTLAAELLPLKKVRHAVTYRSITILPFLAKLKKLPSVRGAKALPLSELSAIAISNLTRKVARSALSAV